MNSSSPYSLFFLPKKFKKQSFLMEFKMICTNLFLIFLKCIFKILTKYIPGQSNVDNHGLKSF